MTNQAERTAPFMVWIFLVLTLLVGASAQVSPPRSPDRITVVGERIQVRDSVQPSSTVGASTTSTNTSYTLLVNDLIRVEVYNEKDLERVTRVDQDGTISLPLIQTVRVAGKTVSEARTIIRGLYEKDYLVSADVDISVVTSSQTNKVAEITKPKVMFTILGEVKKPGNIQIPEGEKLDIVRAIAMAEGFTGVANKRSVTVNRKGDPKPHDVDVQALTRDPKAKPFDVRPGDVIEVRQTIF